MGSMYHGHALRMGSGFSHRGALQRRAGQGRVLTKYQQWPQVSGADMRTLHSSLDRIVTKYAQHWSVSPQRLARRLTHGLHAVSSRPAQARTPMLASPSEKIRGNRRPRTVLGHFGGSRFCARGARLAASRRDGAVNRQPHWER